MEEIYQRQLQAAADRLPGRPCRVALVPLTEPDQAAAIANDFAQLAARARNGHTLLFSLESAPAALDHEIGVEEGEGLVDILAGRVTLAGVAAHGRARGHIYVPAGRHARDPAAMLRSRAWDALARSALERGGTVLAFVPRETWEERAGGAWDGVVWLGAAPGSRAPTSDDEPPALGSVGLPGKAGTGVEVPGVGGPGSGRAASPGPAVGRSGERRRLAHARRRTRYRRTAAVLIVLSLAVLALVAVLMVDV